MKISTSLTKKNRVNIHIDGEYAFTVDALLWAVSGIKEGDTVREEEIFFLKEKGLIGEAYDKAVRLLSCRAHSEKELYGKLIRSYPGEIAQAAVDRCRDRGYIDDEAFAEAYAEELARNKNYSPARIMSALAAKGVDRQTAAGALEKVSIDRDAGLQRAVEKLHLPSSPDEKQQQRAIRRLLSLGYSLYEVRGALKKYCRTAKGDMDFYE